MKKTIAISTNLFIGLLMIFLASYVQAQEIRVKLTGVRSAKGSIMISIFKDQASFDTEQPFKKVSFDKKALEKGMMNVKLNLDPGIYGITLLDDEDGNGKIKKNIIGIPKEGFGFSNFFLEKMKKPTFDDFKVDLKTDKEIAIRVKYM